MQIIGWDPVAKQIHSWVFDSDGTVTEKALGPIKVTSGLSKTPQYCRMEVRPRVFNIMTKLDDNLFKWESVNRDIDGQLQPNIVIR